jgi:hypothetical protein
MGILTKQIRNMIKKDCRIVSYCLVGTMKLQIAYELCQGIGLEYQFIDHLIGQAPPWFWVNIEGILFAGIQSTFPDNTPVNPSFLAMFWRLPGT